MVLVIYADRVSGVAYPSLMKIQEQTGHQQNKILAALKELEEVGLVVKVRAGGGAGNSNRYRIVGVWTPPANTSPEGSDLTLPETGPKHFPNEGINTSQNAQNTSREGSGTDQSEQTIKNRSTTDAITARQTSIVDDVFSSSSNAKRETEDGGVTMPTIPAGMVVNGGAVDPEREAAKEWLARHKVLEPKRTKVLDSTPGLTAGMLSHFWKDIGTSATNPAGVLIAMLEREGAVMVKSFRHPHSGNAARPEATLPDLKAMAQGLIDRCQTHLVIAGRGYPKDRLTAVSRGLEVWLPTGPRTWDIKSMGEAIPDGAGVSIELSLAAAHAQKSQEDSARVASNAQDKRQREEREAQIVTAGAAWREAQKVVHLEACKAAELMKALSEEEFRAKAIATSQKQPDAFPAAWIERTVEGRLGNSVVLAPLLGMIKREMSPVYDEALAEADRLKGELDRLKKAGHGAGLRQ